MLRSIRKNLFINRIVRVGLKKCLSATSSLFNSLIARWPTSGEVDCRFDGQDFKLYNECDDDNIINILYYNNVKYEEESDLKVFISLARHSKTIVDIGANTGGYSVLSSMANRASMIYAIEPYAPNFKRLNINLELNNCSNVKALQVAMGEDVGSIEFTVPENNAISEVSSVNGDFSKALYPDLKWKKQTVPLETMDHLRLLHQIDRIDLIKCDVETYEMSVFRGMDQILKEDRPAILFECFLSDERQAFFNDILQKYGYHVYGVLTEGLVYLGNGFEKNVGGLNYLLSPVVPSGNFINFKYLGAHPELILSNPV